METQSPSPSVVDVFGDENVLFLASRAADAVTHCGGAIAALCRRGRMPFVCVLLDEDAPDFAERTRSSFACLGLPEDRLLRLGVRENGGLDDPALLDAVTRALDFVTWRTDSNVVCGPAPHADLTVAIAAAIADAASRRNGLGLVAYLSHAGGNDADVMGFAAGEHADAVARAAWTLGVQIKAGAGSFRRVRRPLPSAREAVD